MNFRIFAWVILSTLVGCTGQNHSGVGGTTGGTTGSTTTASSSDDACKSGSNLVGCPCDTVGEAHACGACGGGNQVCTAYGEFNKWSDCQGANDGCQPGGTTGTVGTAIGGGGQSEKPPIGSGLGGNPNVGTGNGNNPPAGSGNGPNGSPTPSPSPPCTTVCIPGATQWCDEPIYCNWGQQTCGPDGTWGACVEVTSKPPGCSGDAYDHDCCVSAGQCCQNTSTDTSFSDGNCAGVICQ